MVMASTDFIWIVQTTSMSTAANSSVSEHRSVAPLA
eukprot:SAG31_NODE_4292_length_3375_cov_9.381868_5_plen_35_part_01